MSGREVTVRSVRTVAIEVPLTFPLGTSAATVRDAPMLLIDLQTGDGIVGRSYLFCYRPSGARAMAAIVEEAVGLLAGQKFTPESAAATLARHYALFGVSGAVRMALSAIDVAFWDAAAIAAGLPLVSLLGGKPCGIRAYNSSGLGLMSPEAAADEAEKLLEDGFAGVKLRLGYRTLAEDLAVTRAVRKRIPAATALVVDYNQALATKEAIERGRALQGEGIYWLEEPIPHDDLAGNASIARELDVPVQLGENFNGPLAMRDALAAKACDLVMPDLARIGGVTGWMQAAELAATNKVEMSSHLFPEVSAHLLAVTPTRHWLEWVDWMVPVLKEPMVVRDGLAIIPDRPGNGLDWDDAAVAKFRMQ